MAKIFVKPDCSNAPKKLFLKDLYSSLAEGDVQWLEDNLLDNVVWHIAGVGETSSKEVYMSGIQSGVFKKLRELHIDTMITHGPEVAVSGRVLAPGGKEFSFCDIYTFASAGSYKIKKVVSFVVEEPGRQK